MNNSNAPAAAGKGGEGGPPQVTLQVQTPRGLWNMTQPAEATKRPTYPISAKVAEVIADARAVFGFVEEDSKYALVLGEETLAPERPLASYHLTPNTLLLLSVQGGNA